MERAAEPAERFRRLCLALPEAYEQETWGSATYRVRGRIFAMQGGEARAVTVTCKSPPGVRDAMVQEDPGRFYVPPYVGAKGWIGVRLSSAVDWAELADLIEWSYRATAPKRVAARLDGAGR
ncbi:MAG: MmcQ/YjbR family DNA-binding protein [Candidatus Dormibacteraeota bacterium]|nr:MmcQ/YjbR family DNA-binding protein [Candidatus Dormibacteraeota bacterium]